MVGQTVQHYKIEEKLGRGGMGEVYKARDMKLDRTVALKFLPDRLNADEQAKYRFIQEAKAASAQDHPNICTIYEIGESEGGQLFIAMGYYEGETLKQKIEKGPISPDKAVYYTKEIAKGLRSAHEAGIVHRDIKPANIIVTAEDRVKILDFGLAKLQNTDITRAFTTLGTAAYMSPEQVMGAEIDHRTDIWSLGVVLYELLTGMQPFRGEYEQALMYAITHSEPEPIASIRPDVPEWMAEVVSRMLQKEIDDRYPKTETVLIDLQQAGSGHAVQPTSDNKLRSAISKYSYGLYIATATAIVGLGIVLALFISGTARVPFSERDWLLITDFQNNTGEEIFDYSLKTALTAGIGQSRYANVVPDQKISQVLQRMRREPASTIDADLGIEIAEREGIPVVLVPAISRVGDRYALTGILQDPKTGETLLSEAVRADNKNQILGALDELSAGIRRSLGESVSAINRDSKPLVQVTTESLDALKQFALAQKLIIEADFTKAKFHLERALEIDTAFTAARASLGILHIERSADSWAQGFDRQTGQELLSRAVEQVDDLPNKEKYRILALYASGVENKLEDAAGHYRSLLEYKPDDFAAYNNLGRTYDQMARYEEAARSYKQALKLNTYSKVTYNSLIGMYLWRSVQLDSALVWGRKYVRENPDLFYSNNLLGYAYIGADSLDKALAAIERALSINPESGRDLFRKSRIHWLQGDLESAVEPLRTIVEFNPGTWAEYWLGLLYERMGLQEKARDQYDQFNEIADSWVKHYPDNGLSYIAKGLVLIKLGQSDPGWEIAQKALGTDANGEIYFGLSRVSAAQGDRSRALELLEESIEHGYSDFIWMKIHPDLESLYDTPRFKQLVEQRLEV